jgi:hypothetical protein
MIGDMMKEFQISYKVEGVRVVNVQLPDKIKLPIGWEDMTTERQDEWLYEHQEYSYVKYEDIHYSQADSVLEVRHLKAVEN